VRHRTSSFPCSTDLVDSRADPAHAGSKIATRYTPAWRGRARLGGDREPLSGEVRSSDL
jgi:hypothetical protein